MAKIVKVCLAIFVIIEVIYSSFLVHGSHGNRVKLKSNFGVMKNEESEKTSKRLNMKIDSREDENDSNAKSRGFAQQNSQNKNSTDIPLNPSETDKVFVNALDFPLSSMPKLLENLYFKIQQIFNEEESRAKKVNLRIKRAISKGNGTEDITVSSRMSDKPTTGDEVRIIRTPFPIIAPYYGEGYAFPVLWTSLQKMKADDFPSARSFILPQEHDRFQPMINDEFPSIPRLKKFKMKNNLLNIYKTKSPMVTKNSNSSSSMKTIKWPQKKLNGKRKLPNKEAGPNYPHLSDAMQVRTPEQIPRASKSRYRCKTGTSGTLSIRDGRTISSRGLSYSEDDGADRKSLLCKSETSEITRPNEDIFLKNSVVGLNVITTDYDPFKFLERGENINQNNLEIGSKASSRLNVDSIRNQTVSSVGTNDRDADSMSRTGTKFIYNEGGLRIAIETAADVEGSSTFNIPENQNPLILTSKQEESSSIVQNPSKHMEVDLKEENGDVATFLNYKKKTDFDIAFRNLFDT